MLTWAFDEQGYFEAEGVRYRYRIDYHTFDLSFCPLGDEPPFSRKKLRFFDCADKAINQAEVIDSGMTDHFDEHK